MKFSVFSTVHLKIYQYLCIFRETCAKPAASPTGFRMLPAEQHYEDPRLQAEYLYSLIESEVS